MRSSCSARRPLATSEGSPAGSVNAAGAGRERAYLDEPHVVAVDDIAAHAVREISVASRGNGAKNAQIRGGDDEAEEAGVDEDEHL